MQDKPSYQLRGIKILPKDPVIIGNLEYDDFGQFLIERYNEAFKTKPNLQMNPPYMESQIKRFMTVKYSTVPFNHFIAQLLLTDKETLRLTGGLTTLLTAEQVVENWGSDNIPDINSSVSDFSAVVAYPKSGPNEDLRKRVLRLINKRSIKTPYLVSNLGVKPADNKSGFTFTQNEFTTFQELCSLIKNPEIRSFTKGKYIQSERGYPITDPILVLPYRQSGLHRFYRDVNLGLSARVHNLSQSATVGRVQLIRQPKKKTHTKA